ncbi:MAG: FAD:protein FMN transferase [Lachnospiraceae bacterium]|nr:FAD:protein FMN transferase [Lachnospiraceae bacterium]
MSVSFRLKSFRPAVFLSAILLFLCFVSGACGQPSKDARVSRTSFFLNTVVTITLYGTDDDSLIEECFSLCRDYEAALSRTMEGSEIYNLNHRNTDTVSSETLALINTGLSYSALSGGAFDLTIGSCSSLWDFTGENLTVPEPAALSEALTHVGYEKLSVKGNQISFSDDQTMLDLGAIAKGYIADRIKDFLVENQVASATIDLGGNILCVGSKPDGSDFNIGIQKPFDPQGTPMLTVPVSGWSVVTSGIYERSFEKDGQFYHHILNPATGYPCDNNLLSVTVLSEHSTDGDALSTSCFSLGLTDGMALIDSLEDVYAIFITDDYEIHYSKGLPEHFPVTLYD